MTRRCVEEWPMCTDTQFGHEHEGCKDCGDGSHIAGDPLCWMFEVSGLTYRMGDAFPKEVS